MDHTRHAALFNASDADISLVGCGGIGAATALVLGKMGVGSLTLFDDDVVNDINLATQLHRLSDTENYKVDAVWAMMREFCDDTHIDGECCRVEAGTQFDTSIVISAVDSISARKDIWEAVKGSVVHWYLDARMASEELHVYTVDFETDTSWYEQMISNESDENVVDEPCTSKATIYCSFLSAAIIGKTIKQIVSGVQPPRVFIQNLRNDALTVIP